ncbi:hypothetical protein WOLCODRAFT_123306 [Wolfiporia cocos MD-104 SS10]|uniref:RRM Nup35-type domain-containing protein n=1 Tax=Wolfiporia cocos (strain MD-104) TaxID=742152 RepID=A0A2H3JQS3_WOLCO|nr:hypothetical protein WOLCODRAFT_123306 [Wolfiporia cocos MD-104 SS10]
MFSNPGFSSSYQTSPGHGSSFESSRPSLPHAHSGHQSSTFTVAGVSNSVASPRLGMSSLGGSMGLNAMGDSLSQSRSHYQPGYLLSVSQSGSLPQGSQRHEEAPMVQTKAKLNHVLGGSAAEFGMDSMFESTSRQRHRQPLADEDAPPTNSVNDIVNEVYADTTPLHRSQRGSAFDPSSSRTSLYRSTQFTPTKPSTSSGRPPQTLYVVVFGYPPDKYSSAVEYFCSIGETTEPERNSDLSNCFRLGYLDPAEAMRAVRKNGEILEGSWMVGAKWADPVLAQSVLGTAVVGGPLSSPALRPVTPDAAKGTSGPANMSLIRMHAASPATPAHALGNAARLAPAQAAFRTPTSGSARSAPNTAGTALSPSKGMLEQVSDLIFGW